MRGIILAVASLMLLATPSVLVAQPGMLPLEPNQRIRVQTATLPGGWRVGKIIRLERDTLFMRYVWHGRYEDLAIPISELTRVQLSEGRKSAVGRGVGIGALTAFGMAVILSVTVLTADGLWDDPTAVGIALGGSGLCGVGGGMIGLFIGAVARTDIWREVPLQRPMVTVQRDGSVGIGVSLKLRL